METERPARTTIRWIELDVSHTDGVQISIQASEIAFFKTFVGGGNQIGAVVLLKGGQSIEVEQSYNRIKALLMGAD